MKLFAIFTLLSVVGAFVPKGLAPAPFVRSVDVTLQRDDAAPGVKPLESGYASFAELGEDILALNRPRALPRLSSTLVGRQVGKVAKESFLD